MVKDQMTKVIMKLLNFLERKRWENRQRMTGHIRIDTQWRCLCCPPQPKQWMIKCKNEPTLKEIKRLEKMHPEKEPYNGREMLECPNQ